MGTSPQSRKTSSTIALGLQVTEERSQAKRTSNWLAPATFNGGFYRLHIISSISKEYIRLAEYSINASNSKHKTRDKIIASSLVANINSSHKPKKKKFGIIFKMKN